MRLFCALGLLAAMAAADPLKDYREAMNRLASRERAFWEAFAFRHERACETYYQPILKVGRARAREVNGDLSGFAKLYADYANLERTRGSVYLGLAISGHAKAGPYLVHQLGEAARQIRVCEEELRAIDRRKCFELLSQMPGVRRHGLAVRRERLVDAMRRMGGLRSHVVRGLERKSLRFRIGLLDVTDDVGILNAQLASEESAMRVVAAERLIALGERKLLDPYRGTRDAVLLRMIVPSDAPRETTRFFGIPTRSRHLAFVVDGSVQLARRHESGQTYRQIIVENLLSALVRLPREATFRVVMAGHAHGRVGGQAEIGGEAALPAEAEAQRLAVRMVAEHKPAATNDDPHAALLRAFDYPEVETIYVVYHGAPRATRFLDPDAFAADITRRNRTVRKIIHAVRIGDFGEDAERGLKLLAQRNRGKYTRFSAR
ncbi:MAG: hypothetical protein ACYTGN_15810 [Planctomycetota bacterium]|jgi:hypothetical protein